jgi:GntR family transcriptional regulator, transcriptional repressor for pyruvate dehydrogenase complex
VALPAEPFPILRRPSVVEAIIEHFKAGLIRGELKPGQRLPSEAELGRQYGVGRSAVREAMKTLEALGVVEIQQGNGTYIVEYASSKLLNPLVFAIMLEAGMTGELLELRSLIQVGYCQLAAQNATEADWRHIERAAEAWDSYARNPGRDIEQLTHLDLDFHYSILDATHNPLVIKIGRCVEELFFASIRTTLSQIEGLEWGIEGHRRIMTALRTGDPETVRRAVVASLDYWGEEVKKGRAV